jgi:hypothetical protein
MTRRVRVPIDTSVPVGLAICGWVAILVLVGGAAAPLLAGWLAGIALVALVAARLDGQKRRAAALTLALAFVVLTWVGGLFFVPCALALVVLSPRA